MISLSLIPSEQPLWSLDRAFIFLHVHTTRGTQLTNLQKYILSVSTKVLNMGGMYLGGQYSYKILKYLF